MQKNHKASLISLISVFLTVCALFCTGDKHKLLSQVVRPKEPSRSPPRVCTEDKPIRWRDNERRSDKKDGRGRHEEAEPRSEGAAGRGMERRGDHSSESSLSTQASESRRGKEQRDAITPPAASTGGPDGRDSASTIHEEGKKKTKSQKKNLKKNRKEDENTSAGGDRFNPEPPPPPPSSVPSEAPRLILSPPKMAKKKVLDRRRKRSRGAESDQSEDEQPISKRRRGPQTPPPINKEDLPSQRALLSGHTIVAPTREDTNFSDWSDEEVPERNEASSERAPEPLQPRRNPPLAPLLPDPPMGIHVLPLQPLLPLHMLRKTQPADQSQQRSSSMGSNPSRAGSRRLRSPSNDSAQRTEDTQQGSRARRARGQGANSRDRDRERDRERERERERERAVAAEPIGGREERKSRIDQLRRGEPSRSTSSGNKLMLKYKICLHYLQKCLVINIILHEFVI